MRTQTVRSFVAAALVWSFVASLALISPAMTHADGLADEAQLNFDIGAEHYRQGDFRQALFHFLLSNRLVPNRNVMFNIARTYERLQQFQDAYRWYLDAIDGETDQATITGIREALARIAPTVAILDVQTTPPGATVYIDRRDLGSVARTPRQIAVREATYRVLVELDGYEPAVREGVQATTGQVTTVAFDLRRIVGSVQVSADRGTTVHVDDEAAPAACTAPCTVELPPGMHILYFQRAGYRITPRSVQVVARQTARIRATSTALTGSIVVSADEREALIEVDGRPVGFTPSVVPSVAVGRRRVRVSLRGYVPVERTVTVTEGQQADLRGLHLATISEITAASRLPESVEDAPTSVSIINEQELAAFAYPTIYEALRGVRGVALSFDSTYSAIAVRGLGAPNDFGNRLLLLTDGAILNDSILYQSFTGYDGRVDLGDVSRIEIVRGPGSILYGTGAVSGVVNLVPRSRDEPTSVHFGVGTADDAMARARAGFTLRLGRRAGVSASVAGARSSGREVVLPVLDFDSGAVTPTPVQGYDAYRAGTINARAWWRDFTAQAFFAIRDQEIPTGAFGTRLDDSATIWRDVRSLFELRYEPRLSRAVQLFLRGVANTYVFDANYRFDDDTAATGFVDNFELYTGRWAVGEARVVLTPSDDIRISVGAEIQQSFNADMIGETVATGSPGCDQSSPDDDDTSCYLLEDHSYTLFAGYALAEWTVARWLRLSAGARLDVRTAISQDDSFTAVSPRAAAVMRITPRDILKIMGGSAFRAPSIYELFYHDGGFTQVRPDQVEGVQAPTPESVISSEVEYSHRFSREWIGLVSGHFQRASDIIESPTTTGGACVEDSECVYYANSDVPIFALGADVEVRREWRGGWMLTAQTGFLETLYENEPAEGVGRRVPNQPRLFGSARGVAPLGFGGASLALRLTLEGPRRISLDSDDETEAALVADMVVSGQIREFGVRYSFGVYNVLNWQYSAPVAETFPARTFPQTPRSFLVNLQLTL